MVIINNGDVVELTENSIGVAGQFPSGIELVDASRSGVVNDKVLKERQQLAGEGVLTVAATIDSEGQIIAKPEVHLRGVVAAISPTDLQRKVQDTIAFVRAGALVGVCPSGQGWTKGN